MGAEAHLALIDREVGYAAPEFKQRLARVAVALVLLDRIVRRLLGEAVLQLEGENRQAVDEQPDVQGPLRLVAAVAKLPADREAVLLKPLLRLRVVGRRCAEEEDQTMHFVPDAIPQHVDGAAPADLALQPGEERLLRGRTSRKNSGP